MNPSDLLPALGYFGHAASDALSLPVDGPITGIRLQIDQPGGQALLSLKGVSFFLGGRQVDTSRTARARQSSVFAGDAKHGPDTLLRSLGVHTKAEPMVWWEADFLEPLATDEVRVFNLRDAWARRANHLKVFTRRAQDPWKAIYDAQSTESVLSTLGAVLALAGPFEFRADEPAAALRARVLAACAARLRSGGMAIKDLPWRRIIAVVDLWGSGPLSDDELTVVAGRLLFTHALDPLISWQAKFKSRNAVMNLQRRMNEIAAVHNLGDYVITRHGVQRSRLLSQKDLYVGALRDVARVLAAAGREPVVCYGTLLGAVRDKGFIPHDDDVDMLYRCEATTRAGVEKEMEQVAKLLVAKGYTVRNVPGSLNMHLFDPSRGGLMVDIFPCWIVEGQAHLHMERMSVRSIPASLLFPASSIELYGVTLPAPARPSEFLHERYGDDWNVSNQFFEWPWSLSD